MSIWLKVLGIGWGGVLIVLVVVVALIANLRRYPDLENWLVEQTL